MEENVNEIINVVNTAKPEELVEYLNYLLNKAYEEEQIQDPETVWEDLYDRLFSENIDVIESDSSITYDTIIANRWPEFNFEDNIKYVPNYCYEKNMVETYILSFKKFVEKLNISDTNMFPRFDQWKNNKDIKW